MFASNMKGINLASSPDHLDTCGNDKSLIVQIHGMDGHLKNFLNPESTSTKETSSGIRVCITCQIVASHGPVTPEVVTNGYTFNGDLLVIEESISFDIDYTHLPLDSVMLFRLSYYDRCLSLNLKSLGGLPIFDLGTKSLTFREGTYSISADPPSSRVDFSSPVKYEKLVELSNLHKLGVKLSNFWLTDITLRAAQEKFHILHTDDITLYVTITPSDTSAVHTMMKVLQPEYCITGIPEAYLRCIKVYDRADTHPTPIEEKDRCVSKSYRRRCLCLDHKPDLVDRDKINKILEYTSAQPLTLEERDLIWKYRHYLSRRNNTLPTLIRCVIWSDEEEANQVLKLVESWSEISFENVIEILSIACRHKGLYAFVVKELEKAHDKNILLYLFQLTQYVHLEASTVYGQIGSLSKLLIDRGITNAVILNYLYWYLKVATENENYGQYYKQILNSLKSELENNSRAKDSLSVFERQEMLVDKLVEISNQLMKTTSSARVKTEKLRLFISDAKNGLSSFPPLPLPLDPTIMVNGIVASEASVYRSSSFPLKIPFRKVRGGLCTIIFKKCTDLRIDTFVVKTMKIMESILRKESFDPALCLFDVLPTSSTEGMMQLIPSAALSDVIAEHQSISAYIRKIHGISPDANLHDNAIPRDFIEPYIMSLSSYCVITYLLAVGDRHLDNILLTNEGKIFHIDFGYLFGRDPKPFPPLIKLSQEMVDALGGVTSNYFERFEAFTCAKYITIRKHAKIVISSMDIVAVSNMLENVVDMGSVHQVNERLKLNYTNEDAARHIQLIISDSIGSILPEIMEKLHRVAQIFRG